VARRLLATEIQANSVDPQQWTTRIAATYAQLGNAA
jgi:hypothetical protein